MAFNAFFNKIIYKPCAPPSPQPTQCDSVYGYMQDPSYLIKPEVIPNNDSFISTCSSTCSSTSTLLSSHSTVQEAWPSPHTQQDALNMTTFDTTMVMDTQPTLVSTAPSPQHVSHQQEMWVYPTMDDFTLNEEQALMSAPSPAMQLTSLQPESSLQHQQQQLQSPQSSSDYWLSPMTPSIDAMDMMYQQHQQHQHQQHQQLYMASDAIDAISPFLPSPPQTMLNLNALSPSMHATPIVAAKKKSKKVHRCPHCNHTSNRANNMKEHIMTHDPNRPKMFICNTCNKRFARKHDMKRHTKSHQKMPKRLAKKRPSANPLACA